MRSGAVLLSDVADLIRGVSFRPADLVTGAAEGIPLLRATNIGQGTLKLSDVLYVPSRLVRDPQRLRPFDVVIAMSSGSRQAVGRLGVLRQPWDGCVGAFCGVIRPKPDRVDPPYLGYVLRSASFRQRIETYAVGTAIMNLSRERLLGFTLDLPSVPEQRRIAGILGVLDDKIELNRRMVEVLHELGRSIFESSVSQLRAYRLEEEQTLGEILETLETGARPKGGVAGYSEGIPSIGAESITRLGEFDFGKTRYIPVDYYESMRRGRITSRDVLLYKDGGRPGVFEPHVTMVGDGFPFDVAAINEHVYRLRAAAPFSQNFLYFWLSGAQAMEEMRVKGTGVAIPGLNSTALTSIHVPAMTADRLGALDRALEPLVARVLLAARESSVLTQLRDALLPRLMSGELQASA